MKSLYILIITLLSPLANVVDIEDEYQITDILSVGAYPDLPPYTYEENGELRGFEIDLINEIAKRMELTPEFIVYNHTNEPYEAVKNKKIDCAISSNFLSPKNDDIEYSRTYLSTYEVIMCEKSQKYFRLEDLKDKKIGVLKNSEAEEKAKYLLRSMNFEIVTYDNLEDIENDLTSGNIDAAISDKHHLNYIQKENDSLKFVQELDIKYISIAINSKNPELTEKIDEILLEMEEDGTYHEIYDKWFGDLEKSL
ncbi:ABC transporter substrate-binding protein [Methanococcus maripaludis]|uniref:ABC-type amino acid transport substrate-binding protein n=2 Tax=Methanococcus maripaludis TaxID=39152 RepID=A0A7J9PFL7_METMI|nr:ABC transporter substrate-binding protein [Methanococcus maripaludis]MBA2861477.1 ABC-type amino acid transport substrate-binding protein [Methanococcus maripaludis]